jgi:hypothetical protein
MTNETRKIWSNQSVMAAATCIRVPVMRAHAEAINLELQDDIEEDEARDILSKAPGVTLIDNRCGLTCTTTCCCTSVGAQTIHAICVLLSDMSAQLRRSSCKDVSLHEARRMQIKQSVSNATRCHGQGRRVCWAHTTRHLVGRQEKHMHVCVWRPNQEGGSIERGASSRALVVTYSNSWPAASLTPSAFTYKLSWCSSVRSDSILSPR